MKYLALLYLAGIIAGYALVHLPGISFLATLYPLFHLVGALAMLVFALALIYMGVKSFFTKM